MGILSILYYEALRKGVIKKKDFKIPDLVRKKFEDYVSQQGYNLEKLEKVLELEGKYTNVKSCLELGIGDRDSNYRRLEELTEELLRI